VSVTYRRLSEEVTAGDVILLDDGAMELSVDGVVAGEIHCSVVPMLDAEEHNDEAKVDYCITQAKQRGLLTVGDLVIATSGSTQATGGTNLIKVMSVD
jgi:pyruvate kinase